MKSIQKLLLKVSPMLILGMLAVGSLHAAESTATETIREEPVFAVVNGRAITERELETAFNAALNKKFYHGTVPEGQAEAVHREVEDAMIERVLMEQEITRLGIKPDAADVEKRLAEYDAQYKGSPRWQREREQRLPSLKAQLEVISQFEQMEKKLREAPPPTVEEVRAYYENNKTLFTEPEQVRLSMILLKVDPSSGKAVWDKAREEAKGIGERLQKGADFAETAKLHSGDESAARGGDMGYIHRGMLPEKVEALLDNFTVGAVSEPITLLQGVALVRLDERVTAKLKPFEEVQKRATELLAREREGQARADAVSRLRNAAKVEINSTAKSPVAQ